VTSAKRIISLKKSFNIREGWLPEDDTLPLRFLTETLEGETPASLTKETLTGMIRQYNNFRGWETNGYLKKNDYLDLAKDGVVVNFDQLANARKERESFLLDEN
jgi:aldehyde:ferredoxin oxidoreductase